MNRTDNPFRERGDVTFAMLVFQDMGAPLVDNGADIQTDYLPDFMTGLPVVTWRQKTSVDRDDLDNIRIGNLLQGLVDISMLAVGFTSVRQSQLFLAIGAVTGGLLIFRLLSPNRFTKMEIRSNSTSRLAMSAGERSFSAAISSVTRLTVSSTLILSTVIKAPVCCDNPL